MWHNMMYSCMLASWHGITLHQCNFLAHHHVVHHHLVHHHVVVHAFDVACRRGCGRCWASPLHAQRNPACFMNGMAFTYPANATP
jgi:hypothetical protein